MTITRITEALLRELAEPRPGPWVSLYVPLHHAPGERDQDRIRVRNALRASEDELERRGLDESSVAKMLAPLREALDVVSEGPRPHADGLAMLLSPDAHRTLWVSHRFDEALSVDESPYLVPLARAAQLDPRVTLIALSKSRVRLYRASRTRLEALPLPDGTPDGVEEHLARAGTVDPPSLQHHAAPAGKGPGTQVGVHHGQGRPKDAEETRLSEYVREVARSLEGASLLSGSQPIVLVAVEELEAMFGEEAGLREPPVGAAARCEVVHGSPDAMSEDELLGHVRDITRRSWESRLESATGLLEEARGSSRATADLVDVVRAAHEGRVDTLFARADGHAWGEFDRERGEAVVTDGRGQDLVNLAVRETLAKNGDALVVRGEEASEALGAGSVAAILRW